MCFLAGVLIKNGKVLVCVVDIYVLSSEFWEEYLCLIIFYISKFSLERLLWVIVQQGNILQVTCVITVQLGHTRVHLKCFMFKLSIR